MSFRVQTKVEMNDIVWGVVQMLTEAFEIHDAGLGAAKIQVLCFPP